MNKLAVIGILGGMFASLGWLLALGGIASAQSSSEMNVTELGFFWWTIWFHIFVNIPLFVIVIKDKLFECAQIFVFFITILSTLCMFSVNYVVMTLYNHSLQNYDHEHDIKHSSLFTNGFKAATGGFIIMTFHNMLVGTFLSLYINKNRVATSYNNNI